jgi:hypothetical protein
MMSECKGLHDAVRNLCDAIKDLARYTLHPDNDYRAWSDVVYVLESVYAYLDSHKAAEATEEAEYGHRKPDVDA